MSWIETNIHKVFGHSNHYFNYDKYDKRRFIIYSNVSTTHEMLGEGGSSIKVFLRGQIAKLLSPNHNFWIFRPEPPWVYPRGQIAKILQYFVNAVSYWWHQYSIYGWLSEQLQGNKIVDKWYLILIQSKVIAHYRVQKLTKIEPYDKTSIKTVILLSRF